MPQIAPTIRPTAISQPVAVEEAAREQVRRVAEDDAAGADVERVRRRDQPGAEPAHERHDRGHRQQPPDPLQRDHDPHRDERDRVRDQVAEAGVQERRGDDPGQPVGLARLDAVLVEPMVVERVDDLGDPHQREQREQHAHPAVLPVLAPRRSAAHGSNRILGRPWPPPPSTSPASPRSSARTTRATSPTPGSRSRTSTTTSDVAAGLEERLGRAGRVPVHARRAPGHVSRPHVDDAPVRGLRERQGDQRALPLPDRPRLDGPLDGLRPADPARPRLRRPALRGRGRPHRRRDRHDRRHAPRLRRHPARRGLDVDDDQRARRGAAAALRAGRRGAGRARPSSCAARPRTTSSRSTSRAGTSSTRPSRRCA